MKQRRKIVVMLLVEGNSFEVLFFSLEKFGKLCPGLKYFKDEISRQQRK